MNSFRAYVLLFLFFTPSTMLISGGQEPQPLVPPLHNIHTNAQGQASSAARLVHAASLLGHWAVAAGPSWVEAYTYGSLLFDTQALCIFGQDEVTPQLNTSLRKYLKEVKYIHWDTLPLKLIKSEMQPFIYQPLVCTDTLLFVNPRFYNELTEGEKKAVVAHAVSMIEQKHTLTSACVMAALPLVTHTVSSLYTYCVQTIYEKLPARISSTSFMKNLMAAHEYVATSCILNLIITNIVADIYYKTTAKKYDLNSVKRAGTARELLNYYIKRSQKMPYKSWFSKRNEPTLHQRMKYLMPLLKKTIEHEL